MDDWDRLHAKLMEDPEYQAAWERRRPGYEFARQVIGIRLAAGLTQKELAIRAGMRQPEIARLESGEVSPNWKTLSRVLAAVGGTVELKMRNANGKIVRFPLPFTPTDGEPRSEASALPS